jgi:hypothetical protein
VSKEMTRCYRSGFFLNKRKEKHTRQNGARHTEEKSHHQKWDDTCQQSIHIILKSFSFFLFPIWDLLFLE